MSWSVAIAVKECSLGWWGLATLPTTVRVDQYEVIVEDFYEFPIDIQWKEEKAEGGTGNKDSGTKHVIINMWFMRQQIYHISTKLDMDYKSANKVTQEFYVYWV